MGADWIRRTEEKFKHCLQGASARLSVPSALFSPEEELRVNYPCHWLREAQDLPIDTQLTIFQGSENSRVAVLNGGEAIAEVRGEAAGDLKRFFRGHPQACNLLSVRVVRIGQLSEPFDVRPSAPLGRERTQ